MLNTIVYQGTWCTIQFYTSFMIFVKTIHQIWKIIIFWPSVQSNSTLDSKPRAFAMILHVCQKFSILINIQYQIFLKLGVSVCALYCRFWWTFFLHAWFCFLINGFWHNCMYSPISKPIIFKVNIGKEKVFYVKWPLSVYSDLIGGVK